MESHVGDFYELGPINTPFEVVFLSRMSGVAGSTRRTLHHRVRVCAGATSFVLSYGCSSGVVSPVRSEYTVFEFTPLGKRRVGRHLRFVYRGRNFRTSSRNLRSVICFTRKSVEGTMGMLRTTASRKRTIARSTICRIISGTGPRSVKGVVGGTLVNSFVNTHALLERAVILRKADKRSVIARVCRSISGEILRKGVSTDVCVSLVRTVTRYSFEVERKTGPEVRLRTLLARFLWNVRVL